MSEARLVCRVCDGVFCEREVRLEAVDPEADERRCPGCGSPRMEPYAFGPNAPTENPLQREERRK